jgi:hypothetical protein
MAADKRSHLRADADVPEDAPAALAGEVIEEVIEAISRNHGWPWQQPGYGRYATWDVDAGRAVLREWRDGQEVPAQPPERR